MPPPRVRDRVALAALGAGALATVLAVLRYRAFDLDRFFVPKELALHAAATVAGVALLSGARRVSLTATDMALVAWLALSAMAALFAGNHWLAWRAFTLTASGAAVFWSARRLAAAGLAGAVARTLAAVVVAGALTALAQAYGVKMEFASLTRAPGGTFGNRNFMAHLTAIGVPLIAWCVARARSSITASLWGAALSVCAAAVVLSRARAAWLALAVWVLVTICVAVFGPALTVPTDGKRRIRYAVAAAVAGVVLAMMVPNSLDWKSESPYLESATGILNYREGSGSGRLRQYANSARMVAAHPVLGVGPGNWPVIYPRFAPPDDPSLAESTGMAANPWPSSDWVAAAAERGVPATLALLLAIGLLCGGGLRARLDSAGAVEARLAAWAGAGALGIAAIEGGLDAVLLLPTTTIVVWAAAGALVPPGRELWKAELVRSRTVALAVTLSALGVSSILAGAGKIEAMQLYGVGTLAALESAAGLDPGSYRIRLRAAEAYADRKQCASARRHALAARALFPAAPAPGRVLARCR